jgi:NAD-dependent dihydropyrimidine dehydrogenase PreA subunit
MRKSYLKVTAIVVVMATVLCSCMEPGKAYLSVESNKCKACAVCVGVCQVDAVRIINGKAVIDPTKCVECGRCVEVCPVNAIY